jgi:hypothetical protein
MPFTAFTMAFLSIKECVMSSRLDMALILSSSFKVWLQSVVNPILTQNRFERKWVKNQGLIFGGHSPAHSPQP